MNIFMSTAVVNVQPGYVVLNKDQANRRNHILVKVDDTSIDDLDLSEEELKHITPSDDKNAIAVYKLIGATQFKRGEVFGYDGDLNKALTQHLVPAAEIEEQLEQEKADDIIVAEDVVEAIGQLEVGNAAHFSNNTNKPEIKVLSGLLNRKVTGKERDAAYEVFCKRQDAVIEAIELLDDENKAHFDDEGTPQTAALSEIVGREVTDRERDVAWAMFEEVGNE